MKESQIEVDAEVEKPRTREMFSGSNGGKKRTGAGDESVPRVEVERTTPYAPLAGVRRFSG